MSVARLLLVCTLVALPVHVLAGDLSIATFNANFLTRPTVHVRYGLPLQKSRWTDQQRAEWEVPGFRDQKFAEAVDLVAPLIATIDADVVALTEVGNLNDVNELNQDIGALGVSYPHVAVCDCKDNTTQQHVAVLSKLQLTDVLSPIPGREGYYAETDDADSEDDTGISKGMKVAFQAEGQQFHLYVLHLKSERGFSESDEQRIAQASIVRRHTLPLINSGELVIVAGDLNDHRGQPTIRRIRGFDDLWPDLMQTGNTKYFDKDELGERWTHQFQGMRHQIDHLLLSRSIKEITSKIQARVHAHNNPDISDHRPLIVTLTF